MVLPVEAYHIFKLTFLDAAATDVYRDVFVLVAILQQLSDAVDGVAIELLDAGGWEGHCNDTLSNIGEVKVITMFFEAILWTTNDLPQKVHFIY